MNAIRESWTTADYESLSWHDCHVHGFHLGNVNEDHGTAELDLDVDFIVEWLPQGDRSILFRVAPATLTFHDVSSMRFLLDYCEPGAGMTPFSLDRIEREPVTYGTGYTTYRWRLPVNWPAGEITFESPGFTQQLRRQPVLQNRQSLSTGERCG